MDRRHFLSTLPALAATAASTGLLGSAQAKPALAAAFAENAAGQPLLAPFKGVGDITGDCDTAALATRGRWPEALRGRFYRNGPAVLQRGEERYHHWFDGDGMVQQFTLAGGRIAHRGRLVRTVKLQAEQKAGRFLMDTLGTSIEGGPPGAGPDSYNTANTNALEHAGRVLAMWEGGSAYAMSPADLSTQGPVTWRDDLQGLPFSAHPKLDADGSLWNIGTMGKHLLVWQVDAAGKLVRVQLGESPFPNGMVHDMAITERHVVVPLPPVRLAFGQSVDGPRRFALVPGEPLRVLVMEKADITRRRVFELPPQMLFHVGNAHDAAGGEIVLSYIGASDAWFLDRGAVALMNGTPEASGRSSTHIARLHMASGKATTQDLFDNTEFPRLDPRRVGRPARYLLTGASWRKLPGRNNALLHGLQLRDMASNRVQRFDYGPDAVVEEHILVPKPGKSGELDAWVLGTTFDAKRQMTVLNLLDAARIASGPIAQATLPYILPLGFHGNFTAA